MKRFRPTVVLSSLLLLLVVGGCIIDVDGDGDGSTGATAETDPNTTAAGSSETGEGSSSGGSSGADDSSSGTTGGAGFVHCEPGPEMPLSADAMGEFSMANQDGQASTMGLSTPAGGYVTATFAPGLARGGLVAFGGGKMDIFGSVEGDYEEPVNIAFLAAPGTSYRLEGRQQGNANPDEYPFGWTLSWSAVPIPDCWEPNDSMDDAAEIVLGESISGYINAGQVDADPVPQEGWLDYYRFEVDEPGTLTVDMKQVPGDGLVRARVFDAAGEPVGSLDHPSDENELFAHVLDLDDPGTYFLEVHPFLRPTLSVADDSEDGIPSSWTTPYIFELTLDPS